jgi:hypothetical protein
MSVTLNLLDIYYVIDPDTWALNSQEVTQHNVLRVVSHYYELIAIMKL